MNFDPSYHFCKFRIPKIGGRVIWEITNECNYGCKYCIFASTGKKPEGELSTQQVYDAIDQLKENNFNYIKFTGGEPFLREDMSNILEYAVKSDILCDISTNASRITPSIATRLKILNLEMVHVSLDGANKEQHEAVRGKKSFQPTIEGIKILLSEGIKIRVGCVIHSFNEWYLKEICNFCEDLKIDEIIFSMMEPVGRLRGKSFGLSTRNIEDLDTEIKQLRASFKIKISSNLSSLLPLKSIDFIPKQIQTCPGGKKFLFINSLGVVSPCTWVSEKKPQWIGSKIHEKSLKQIIQMNGFKELNHFSSSLASKGLSICPVNYE